MNRSVLEFNGNFFELLISQELKQKFPNSTIILNKEIFSYYLRKTTQIDLIFVHPKLVAAIEAKNWKSWVQGGYNDHYWKGVSSNPNVMTVHSPLEQNFVHIRALRNAIRRLGIEPPNFINLVCFPDGTEIYSDCREVVNLSTLLSLLDTTISNSSDSINVSLLSKLINMAK